MAYELGAHARITQHAFARSALVADAQILSAVGLSGLSGDLGSVYFDLPRVSGEDPVERLAHPFDSSPPLLPQEEARSIAAWLIRGAIREDDLTLPGCIGATVANAVHLRTTECNPRGPDGGDPHGDFDRVLHHFYDPYYKRGFVGGEKAPDWATGSIDAFSSPNKPYLVSRNHFSLMSAREAMFRALTGRRSSDRQLLEPLPDGKAQTPEQIRNAWWATAFRALGDAVHLVQDMAQPQHTRHDAHPGSVFEGWIDARALGSQVYSLSGVSTAPLLDYGNHPIPQPDRYSALWSTGASGLGLADYSNREFFTEDSNFGSAAALQYPSPPSVPGGYKKETAALSVGANFAAEVSFLRGAVHDRATGSQDEIRMTTESVFDAWAGLGIVPIDTQYTMNRQVFDDQARLLVPRAVAYSAGLIDYFFRGRIDFHPDPNDPSSWVLRNLGTEDMKGGFTLYYDAVDGKRHPVPGTMPDQTWVYLEVPAGGQLDGLSFSAPTDPAPRFPGEYMLVFTGEMGNERADAGNVGAVAAKYVSGGDLIVSALNFSGTGYNVYRSTDLGSTWKRSAFTSSRGPSFMRYLGGGGVLSESLVSLDAGEHWIDVSAAGLEAKAWRADAAPAGGPNLISTYQEKVPISDDTPLGTQAMLVRSADHGASWSAVTLLEKVQRRLRDTTYMGNGRYVAMGLRWARTEACPFGQCEYFEYVLYQSATGGSSWEPVALIDLDRIVSVGRHVVTDGKLVPDPDGQPVLLASRFLPSGDARHQFVRSLDGGISWSTVGFPAEVQHAAPDYYTLWQLAAVGNGVIVAYFHSTSSTNRHALFRSVDAGETWQRLGDPPPGTADPGLFGMTFIPLTRTLPGI